MSYSYFDEVAIHPGPGWYIIEVDEEVENTGELKHLGKKIFEYWPGNTPEACFGWLHYQIIAYIQLEPEFIFHMLPY